MSITVVKKQERRKESRMAQGSPGQGKPLWRFVIWCISIAFSASVRLHLHRPPFGKRKKIVRTIHPLLKMRGPYNFEQMSSCQSCMELVIEGNVHCNFYGFLSSSLINSRVSLVQWFQKLKIIEGIPLNCLYCICFTP